jgi:hypothetical protein
VKGELRWDVPDLQVLVRADMAVTWRLNRMQTQEPGKQKVELWVARHSCLPEGRWQVEDDPLKP